MPVPAFVTLPNSLKLAGALGFLQAIGLAAYAVSIIGFELSGSTSGIHGSDLAPGVLVTVYFLFAVMIAAVTYLLLQQRRAARTPFLLIQAFGLVIAQPLVSGANTLVVGIVIIVTSVAAAALCLAPQSGKVLQ